MKIKMEQTAVEWLVEKLDQNFDYVADTLIEQAKEMEKKQIIEARLKPLLLFKKLREEHGYFGGHDNGQVIDREINESELYYTNTYKSE